MISIIGMGLAHFFGKRALKAVVGGVVAAGSVAATTAMQACDIESVLTQVMTVGATGLAGWLATYVVPNKK